MHFNIIHIIVYFLYNLLYIKDKHYQEGVIK